MNAAPNHIQERIYLRPIVMPDDKGFLQAAYTQERATI
jgi:hypothetical protein